MRAIEWYEAAARQGYAKAQYNLALSLLGGGGDEAEDRQAIEWLLAASDKGYAKAQYLLATIYQRGIVSLPIRNVPAIIFVSPLPAAWPKHSIDSQNIANRVTVARRIKSHIGNGSGVRPMAVM